MEFVLENYEISRKILVPFVLEIKNLLKKTPEFQYVENENGIVDPNSTKSYITVENSGAHALREKYPLITLGRSALEFFIPYLASQANNQDMFDDNKEFGEAFQTNIHIQVDTHSKVMSERLASYIFNYFRFNKHILRNYGITDVRFNYMSQPIGVKNSDDETITVYQVGINAMVKVYESAYLERIIDGNLVDKFIATVYPSANGIIEDGTGNSGEGLTLEDRIAKLEEEAQHHSIIMTEDDEPEIKDFWFDIEE